MSDLNKYEMFVTVVREGGIARAAKTLQISRAAVSQQIKRLEQQVQVDLFTRKGRQLQLTPEGQVFYDRCERLQKELDDTRSLLSQFHAQPQGELSILVHEHFAEIMIYPYLEKFLNQYPKLLLHIDTTEIMPDFKDDSVDIVMGFSLPAPPDIVQRKISETRYALCATPEYLKRFGEPKTLNDLLQHRYIAHRSRPKEFTINLKPKYSLNIKPAFYLNSTVAMLACAKNNIGIIQLHHYLVEEALKKGELVEVLREYQRENVNVYLYYQRFRYVQPKIRKFIDFIMECNP